MTDLDDSVAERQTRYDRDTGLPAILVLKIDGSRALCRLGRSEAWLTIGFVERKTTAHEALCKVDQRVLL